MPIEGQLRFSFVIHRGHGRSRPQPTETPLQRVKFIIFTCCKSPLKMEKLSSVCKPRRRRHRKFSTKSAVIIIIGISNNSRGNINIAKMVSPATGGKDVSNPSHVSLISAAINQFTGVHYRPPAGLARTHSSLLPNDAASLLPAPLPLRTHRPAARRTYSFLSFFPFCLRSKFFSVFSSEASRRRWPGHDINSLIRLARLVSRMTGGP